MKRKTVIVWLDRPLTKEQRRMFSKEHPGMRLSFQLRFPNFLLVMDAVLLGALVALKAIEVLLQ